MFPFGLGRDKAKGLEGHEGNEMDYPVTSCVRYSYTIERLICTIRPIAVSGCEGGGFHFFTWACDTDGSHITDRT